MEIYFGRRGMGAKKEAVRNSLLEFGIRYDLLAFLLP